VSGAWPPERIRAEGSPLDTFDYQLGSAPAGLDAQLYCTGGAACDAYDWRPITPAEERASHWALEMTQDARSVLFDVQGVPWARYFGEDSIIVEDGIGQAVRIRQLRADGTAVQLRPLSEPAPATPGRDVMLAPTLDRADNGKGTAGRGEVPYLVDERAGTLQPLDVPQEVEAWGPNVDEFLWGVNGCRVVWQQTDGAFAHHDVDCRRPGLTDLPVDYWSYLDSWAKPGRMALVEHDADGVPLVVHASVDRGATWKRIQIEDRNRDGTLAQAGPAIADALGQLD
jgi:hypothetical protein